LISLLLLLLLTSHLPITLCCSNSSNSRTKVASSDW
jgi:hypothetical protein